MIADRDHLLTQLQVEKAEALEAVPNSLPPIQLEIMLPGLATAAAAERHLHRDQAFQRPLQGEERDLMG